MTSIDSFSLATVPIIPVYRDRELSAATGFIWSAGGVPFLITNWHVVAGRNQETGKTLDAMGSRPDRVRLWMNQSTHRFGKISIEIPLRDGDSEPLWLVHPVHKRKIDVVALRLPQTPPVPNIGLFPINELESDRLAISIGLDVFILGYPFGFRPPGFPVWKRGSIASEPDLAPLTDKYFLVDSASRPGMSGSPVVRRSWNSHSLANDSIIVGPGTMTSFVGVYSGRVLTSSSDDPQLARVWPRNLVEEILQIPTYDVADEWTDELRPPKV